MFLESFNDKDHKKQCRYEIPMYKNADATGLSLCVRSSTRFVYQKICSLRLFVCLFVCSRMVSVRDTKVKRSRTSRVLFLLGNQSPGPRGSPEEPRFTFPLVRYRSSSSFPGVSDPVKLLTTRRIDSLSKKGTQPARDETQSRSRQVCAIYVDWSACLIVFACLSVSPTCM